MSEVIKDRIELLDRLGLEGKACAEIGVCHGEYSREILHRSPRILYLVDSWACEGMKLRGKDAVRNGMGHTGYLAVSLLFRDNPLVKIIRKTSFEASFEFGNGELDFVYIDADHSLPFAYADLLLWYPKVKRGGWIAGHDYNLSRSNCGVAEAVRMFASVSGEKLSFLTGEAYKPTGKPNSFAMEKTR